MARKLVLFSLLYDKLFLCDVSSLRDTHTAMDTLMEMVGWMLYGVNHASNKMIKVTIESL